MKKEYQAPYLVMESFQLDAAIAATCSSQEASVWGESMKVNKFPLNYSEDTCVPDNGLDHFNLFNCQMDVTPAEGDGADSVCYQAPFWYLDVYIYS